MISGRRDGQKKTGPEVELAVELMVFCDPPEVVDVVGRCGLEAGGATSLRDCIVEIGARRLRRVEDEIAFYKR